MKDLFNKEKIIYKNIEIPEDLDFLVIKSINEGKKRNNRVGLISKIVAATFITIFITLNLFPEFSIVAQNLPIIGKLAQFLTIDKGFGNAVEAGLVQNIGYENEINGIKLKVSNIVGDNKAMWIEYEVEDGYNVNIELMDINDENEIRAFSIHSTEAYGKSGNYIKVNFEKFEQEFLLVFNVYNIDESENLSVFKVPVKLEDKFNNDLKEININNNLIKTEIGDIEIKDINTSKTTTSMSFILNSNDYNFVKFENPVLIDRKGNEYKLSSSYLSMDNYENNNMDFEGEIKGDNIIFKCDGIFYDKKYGKKVVVDLNNEVVQENEYNTTFESYENNILKLKTENVEEIEFKNEDDKYKLISKAANGQEVGESLYKINEIITSFDILDKDDGIMEIEIESIAKDKIKGFEFEING
jgi:hypothetical protein